MPPSTNSVYPELNLHAVNQLLQKIEILIRRIRPRVDSKKKSNGRPDIRLKRRIGIYTLGQGPDLLPLLERHYNVRGPVNHLPVQPGHPRAHETGGGARHAVFQLEERDGIVFVRFRDVDRHSDRLDASLGVLEEAQGEHLEEVGGTVSERWLNPKRVRSEPTEGNKRATNKIPIKIERTIPPYIRFGLGVASRMSLLLYPMLAQCL